MRINFIDIIRSHKQINNELLEVIKDVISESAFVYGKYLKEFEDNFAEKNNVRNCIGVANGTDALTISLKCLGVANGDEVITAANSFVASAEAISNVGAIPVFVDNDEYFGINVDLIEDKITDKTKAIMPVHLYGQCCDIEKIVKIAQNHNLYVVEDVAQAHFVKYKERYAGSFGDTGCYSFYPSKNLGALGDGGAIITNNDELATKIRQYTNHGSIEKYKHKEIGINSRLDGLQAAVLNVKLKYIDEWNSQRNKCASLYDSYLADCMHVKTPLKRNLSDHFYHLYVICCRNRDNLQKYLAEKGIQTGIHYPTAIPFLDSYRFLKYSEQKFPLSFINQSKILSLPLFPELSEREIKYVTDSIKDFYKDII
jgi:dTDP-4-amino-4,6-dideoxygalactose transaminase